jgi:hypothetical protein
MTRLLAPLILVGAMLGSIDAASSQTTTLAAPDNKYFFGQGS